MAEDRTKETRSFVRRVKTITRRKYTAEEKIRIVFVGNQQKWDRKGAERSVVNTRLGQLSQSLVIPSSAPDGFRLNLLSAL